MIRMRTGGFIALGLFTALTAAAGSMDAYLMEREEELALAATAGPPAVTAGATYYVLGEEGFGRAAEGDNGFHCFVERSWTGPTSDNRILFDPQTRAPHCINEVGARSTMEEMFLVSRLAMAGRDGDEIEAQVDRAYADGELRLPVGLSMTYMMSKHQDLGQGLGAWRPHLMLWIPYLEGVEAGPFPPGSAQPQIFNKRGSRRTVLVVPVASFIE